MIQKTNSNSCTLDCVSFVTDIPVSELIESIGHDGTFQDGSPRGFASQEFILPLLERGWWLTYIELSPEVYNGRSGDYHALEFADGQMRRFVKCMESGDGVLVGVTSHDDYHAVAWINGIVHNPSDGLATDIFRRDERGRKLGFTGTPIRPDGFWRIGKYEQT